MYYSKTIGVGNNSTTLFPAPTYDSSISTLVVTVDGVPKTLSVDYEISGGNVQFYVAPATGLIVIISRDSHIMSRLVDYTSASMGKYQTANKDSDQLLYLIQESIDICTDAIGDMITGGSYNSSTGIITFTDADGVVIFTTDDVRGDKGETGDTGLTGDAGADGIDGADGTDGADGGLTNLEGGSSDTVYVGVGLSPLDGGNAT